MGYRFHPKAGPALAVILVVPCFVALGLWQIDRAAEKRARLAEFEARSALPPMEIDLASSAGPVADLYWRRMEGRGTYLPPVFLLDNRVRNGEVGYEVLQAARSEGGHTVLVDRGWVPAPADRSEAPEAPSPNEPQPIAGHVGPPPTVGISLRETPPEALAPDRYRVQRIDLDRLAAHLRTSLLPFVLYLDKQAPAGYERRWPPPASEVGKHYAYAAQWFAMAAIAMGIFVVRSLRRGA